MWKQKTYLTKVAQSCMLFEKFEKFLFQKLLRMVRYLKMSPKKFKLSRDGILRERREHARGRNLADCGRICGSPRKSFGSIEEMWKKYSK